MLNRVLIIFFVIASTIAYSIYQKKQLETSLVSDSTSSFVLAKLPDVTFHTLEGKPFNLNKLYTGGDVSLLVIHYWGTWCAPCEAELPELLKLIKHFEDRPDVKFLLVAVNDEAEKVKKHLKSLPLSSKSSIFWLLDSTNAYRDQFNTTRVPETYVFSSDKSTLRKFVGPQEWNKPMFFQTFDEFLQISTRKL